MEFEITDCSGMVWELSVNGPREYVLFFQGQHINTFKTEERILRYIEQTTGGAIQSSRRVA